MTRLPTDRELVDIVAWLPTSVTGLPRLTPSTLNWTVPVRVPAPGATGLTVAVKVTDCPTTDGFCELVTPVVVLALLTVCVSVLEVEPVKLESPLYSTVTE